MKKTDFSQDERITIEDEEEGDLIEKNSLLLRKQEFQDLFKDYFFDRDQLPETPQLKTEASRPTHTPQQKSHRTQPGL